MKTIFLLCLLVLYNAASQRFHLAKDINTAKDGGGNGKTYRKNTM